MEHSGGGGHTEALLKNTPDSLIIVGLDSDHSAVQAASSRLSSYKSRFMAIHGNFGEPTAWIDKLPKKPIFRFLLTISAFLQCSWILLTAVFLSKIQLLWT